MNEQSILVCYEAKNSDPLLAVCRQFKDKKHAAKIFAELEKIFDQWLDHCMCEGVIYIEVNGLRVKEIKV